MSEVPEGIAIIGMSGRFPGASDLDQLWRNLRDGVESITFWSREELERAGADPALLDDPRYVPACGAISGVELFDAPFFGIGPREAEAMDPQHRLFLEHCWEALENAGYDAESYAGLIGIFGGMGMSNYLLSTLLTRPEILDALGPLHARVFNDKDFVVALAAFKMGLTGPSICVQSACSTSLLATSVACQSLMSYQCDIALAGGVTINVPQAAGYVAIDSVSSPDGHCRAFDAGARGTVQGSGVGVVVLKRLADALADGDTIRAVIKGYATNNDGSLKMGYTAPGVEGQIQVIAMAQAVAGIRGDTITYMEAHGTGTPLGDPIEVEALTEVFRAATDRTGTCALGSVKTNVGHLDAAAGVASLIKTVLALENRVIPPHPTFASPNPQIDLAGSPFYVNTEARPWRTDGFPRRAGVSSFAIGGTNVHLVLEEAPPPEPPDQASPAPPWHLLLLSARTETALEKVRENLLRHLRERPEMTAEDLADAASTLQSGRRPFRHRRALVCRGRAEAMEILETKDARRLLAGSGEMRDAQVAFLFPGLGNQYPGMGLDLYRSEPRFREVVDECCAILEPELGLDLRTVLYPEGMAGPGGSGMGGGPDLRAMLGTAAPTEAERRLARTELAQPAVFVVELALGRLLIDMGLRPDAMIGFSIGEYVAACLSGVLDVEDALRLVARRAKLIGELPEGGMLAVPAGEREAAGLAGSELSVAALLGPELTVLAGPEGAVAALEGRLAAEGKVCKRLQTTHAFHSRMMDPIAGRFRDLFRGITLREPEIPYLSNVTGTWITPEQATSPDWWGRHLREAVRFSDGVAELWREPGRLMVEVGPGQTLGAWALQHPAAEGVTAPVAVPTLRHAWDRQDDSAFLLTALGRLWLAGVRLDGLALSAGRRRRVPLPTYPFERQRYWIEPARGGERKVAWPLAVGSAATEGTGTTGMTGTGEAAEAPLAKRPDPADWFYLPLWKQTLPLAAPAQLPAERCRWLLFAPDADPAGLAARLTAGLRARGGDVIAVLPGERFASTSAGSVFTAAYSIDPDAAGDYQLLFEALGQLGWRPDAAAWLWGLADPQADPERDAGTGFFRLLSLAQALGRHVRHPLHLTIATAPVHRITGAEALSPGRATALGPALVIPQELPNVSCRVLDVDASEDLPDLLLAELAAAPGAQPAPGNRLVAYRAGQRWTRVFEPLPLGVPGASDGGATRLRDGGVYLITGGLGGVGLALAERLAQAVRAKLVLVGRSPVPGEKPEALRRIEEKGGEVLALSADVTDEASMRRAVEAARARFGRIDGVIHAAGVPPGGLMQLKDPAAAAAVLAPKVRGTLVLERVLRADPPDFLLLCSSLTAVAGAFGLADHCAANAFLDAFAQQRAGRAPHILSVSWDTWLEVGQAAEAARQRGLGAAVPARDAKETVGPPWLGLRLSEGSAGDARQVFSTELSTSTHWVVDEHRIAGDGVLPGTASVEMIRAASAERTGGDGAGVEIRRLVFLSPLRLRDGETREVQVVVDGAAGEAAGVSLESRPTGSGEGGAWERHAEASVARTGPAAASRRDLAAICARCEPREVPAELAEGESPLSFGPRWRGLLRELWIGAGEGLGTLELDSRFHADLDGGALHPALLDAATGCVQLLRPGVLHLPLGYEEIMVRGALPPRVHSHFGLRGEAEGDTLTCDLSILDEEGNERLGIRGYTLRRLQPESWAPAPSPATRTTAREAAPASAAGDLHGLYGEGLLPAEGGEVLLRLLAASVRSPHVLVSTRDLPALLRRAETLTRSRVLGMVDELQSRSRVRPRPELPTAYAAPRNDVEKTVARAVSEVLRVEPVGIHDNFFDLGGDSLMAARLIGGLGDELDVQLSLSTVFESPSVAEMAVAVVRAQASHVSGDVFAEALAEIQQLSPEELRALLAEEEPTQR